MVTVGGVPSNGVNFTVQSGFAVIPRTNWALHFVDSQETSGGENGAATNTFDGKLSAPSGTLGGENIEPDPPPPHEIQINLDARI